MPVETELDLPTVTELESWLSNEFRADGPRWLFRRLSDVIQDQADDYDKTVESYNALRDLGLSFFEYLGGTDRGESLATDIMREFPVAVWTVYAENHYTFPDAVLKHTRYNGGDAIVWRTEATQLFGEV